MDLKVAIMNTEECNDDELVILKRGRGSVLLCNGYQFYKHSYYHNGTSKWRCRAYKEIKCAGSVTINIVSTSIYHIISKVNVYITILYNINEDRYKCRHGYRSTYPNLLKYLH